MRVFEYTKCSTQGEEGVSERCPQSAQPRANRSRGQGQLPQVYRHSRLEDDLSTFHENAEEDQEDRFGRRY